MSIRAWAIVAALLASGCSGPKPSESDEARDTVPVVIRAAHRPLQVPALLPFTTIVSNGSEIFAWPVNAFVPSAFVVHLTEDTTAHGAVWRPLAARSRVPNDNFMVYVIAPESAWTEAKFGCGGVGADWLFGFQSGGTGNLTHGLKAGRWIVMVVATTTGTAVISLGRSPVANPGQPDFPRTPVEATHSSEPLLSIDATINPPNPAGAEFEANFTPPTSSFAWVVVRGTHVREPESRVVDGNATVCAEQIGANDYTSDPSAPGFVVMPTTLRAGDVFTWSGVQAQYGSYEEAPRGALTLVAPRIFPIKAYQ